MIPSGELQTLLEALTDEGKLLGLLESLDSKQLEQALERLEDYQTDYQTAAVLTAVPILINQMGRLSREPGGFLGIAPRVKASRVVLRLLWKTRDPETLANQMDEILPKISTLSGRLELVEMVGHRESGGHKLVSEERGVKLEKLIVKELISATSEQLGTEWDLIGLSLRPLRWLETDKAENLADRLREHLADNAFVFNLLRKAVGTVYSSDGHRQKRLPWDALVVVFGDELTVAVERLANCQTFCDTAEEEDSEIIQLAQTCAAGTKTDDWEES